MVRKSADVRFWLRSWVKVVGNSIRGLNTMTLAKERARIKIDCRKDSNKPADATHNAFTPKNQLRKETTKGKVMDYLIEGKSDEP